MSTGVKILISSLVVLATAGIAYFLYQSTVNPQIIRVDWINKTATIRQGQSEYTIQNDGMAQSLKNGFSASLKVEGKIMTVTVVDDKNRIRDQRSGSIS